MKTKNVKAIVVACNTASAFALDTIEKEIDIPIIGVVKPGAKSAVESTKNKRIGIIGTEGTIKVSCTHSISTALILKLRWWARHVHCLFRWWKKECFTIP